MLTWRRGDAARLARLVISTVGAALPPPAHAGLLHSIEGDLTRRELVRLLRTARAEVRERAVQMAASCLSVELLCYMIMVAVSGHNLTPIPPQQQGLMGLLSSLWQSSWFSRIG